VLTKREENRLLVFERKVLSTIYGPKIIDGVYRSMYNFNSSNVIGDAIGHHDKRCQRPTIESHVLGLARRQTKPRKTEVQMAGPLTGRTSLEQALTKYYL
jgi:hypothetical protein